MNKSFQRIVTLVVFIALLKANGNGLCRASDLLNTTGGFVNVRRSSVDFTFIGYTCLGESFVFTVSGANGNYWTIGDLFSPGANVSPYLQVTDGDFGGYSLLIDGIDAGINGSSAFRAGSSIEIDGPPVQLPDPFVNESQTLYTPVNFDFEFNLYDNFDPFVEPTYIIAGAELGNAQFVFNPSVNFPDTYELGNLRYELGPTIPEPSSTALLGVCLIAGWMRRRRS